MTAVHTNDFPPDRDACVKRYLPLARSLAARNMTTGEPFDDVFQVACIGLIKAVDRFDPSRRVAFSSYATPTIVGEIKRYYRDRTWAVHVPRDLLELSLRVQRARDELAVLRGRPASVADIAQRLHADEDDVRRARDALRARRATSIAEPRGTDDETGTIEDSIGVEELGFGAAEHRATIDSIMRCLPPRSRDIIRMRLVDDLTQEAIGARVSLSQMQVSRILRSALERLQTVAATMS